MNYVKKKSLSQYILNITNSNLRQGSFVEEKVQLFLQALLRLSQENPFEANVYADRHCKAAKSTSALKHFDHNLIPDHEHRESNLTMFDGLECKDHVAVLAAAAIARGMGNNADDFGFHEIVKKVFWSVVFFFGWMMTYGCAGCCYYTVEDTHL